MRFTLFMVLGLALARPLAAQSTPEAAATLFGAAIRESDWAAAARLMHPSALKQLRQLFEPLIAAPNMEELGAQLFGVHSAAELATVPDTILFATFLLNVMAQQAGLGEALRTATIEPLGHVAQGADTMLVVSRLTLRVEGVSISQFEVMPFVSDRGRWWGLLKADFTNMAALMQKALDRRPS
jgi:hypothetical protein